MNYHLPEEQLKSKQTRRSNKSCPGSKPECAMAVASIGHDTVEYLLFLDGVDYVATGIE